MKVSVCLTVLNEERSIRKLILSLLNQSKKPNEIVIVDGGSTDNTLSIISNLKLQMSRIGINLKLIQKKCTRAEGRNLSVKKASNELIAITDADCIAKKDWLVNITRPFKDKEIEIVAGFYDMVAKTDFQKAESVFLGVMPRDFNEKTFLPSTRSMAFRKSAWERVGGFPETGNNSAEDTDFNYKAVKMGLKYARVKSARVEWSIPDNLADFAKKIYNYAKWDAQYGIVWHPTQKLSSHNIKSLFKLVRYFLGLLIALLGLVNPLAWFVLIIGILIYFYWSFIKVYKYYKNVETGIWGIVLQFVSDLAGMSGFKIGLIKRQYHTFVIGIKIS
jgi:glycosyltransferase involved in cell wall biosynthesis